MLPQLWQTMTMLTTFIEELDLSIKQPNGWPAADKEDDIKSSYIASYVVCYCVAISTIIMCIMTSAHVAILCQAWKKCVKVNY